MNKIKIMKKSYLLMAGTAFVLGLSGCASDDIAGVTDNGNNENAKNTGTTFIATKGSAETRTHAKTDLVSKFEYFWDEIYGWGTQGDNIRVESTPGTWLTSDLGVIKDGEGRVATFNFPGATLTDSEYMVYYGQSTTNNDIVTIPSLQNGSYNSPHHQLIGDCGVGKATRNSSGDYTFKLHHKAAYAAVTWHCPDNTLLTSGDYKYASVIIKADENMCGTYQLPNTESGQLTLVTAGSNSITASNYYSSMSISTSQANTDTVFFCIPPGTYHNVSIAVAVRKGMNEYQMLARHYPSVTFKENELQPFDIKLEVPDYSDRNKFYMWGAKNHYWYGYENEQKYDGTAGTHYPQDGDANGRYAKTTPYPFAAGTPQTTCPNINETLWYIQKGDPIWDPRPFTYNGNLCYGGVWFKKKANISGFSDAAAPDGTDYRLASAQGASGLSVVPTQYAGQDLTDYFFLPSIGLFRNGQYVANANYNYRHLSNNTCQAAYWVNGSPGTGLQILFPSLEISANSVRLVYSGMFSITNWQTGTPLWKAE